MRLSTLYVVALVVALLAYSLTGSSATTPTGVTVVVSNSGLNEVIKDIIPAVIKSVEETPIADVNGTTDVTLIGKVDYSLTNITISNVEVGSFVVNNTAPNKIGVVVNGIKVVIQLLWAYRQESWPHAAGHGDATATATDSNMVIDISVSVDSKGKPVLKADYVKLTLGALDVKISGGISGWVLNLLESLFKTTIKNAAESAISDEIADEINNDINQQIQKTDLVIPIPGQNLEFDASLSEQFVVTPQSVAASIKAEMYNTLTHEEAPFTPVKLPTTLTTGETIEINVAEYVGNAAGYAALKAGTLKITVTPDMVPDSSPIKLNTTSLQYMIPELYAKYPNQLVQLDINALKAPGGTINPSGLSGSIDGSVEFSVINSDKSITSCFTLEVVASATVDQIGAKSSKDQFNITGHISNPKISLTLLNSNIGPVNVTQMSQMIQIIVISGVVSSLNKKLADGVPIELPSGLSILNPKAILSTGYLTIAGDVSYTPSFFISSKLSNRIKNAAVRRLTNRLKQLRTELENTERELQYVLTGQRKSQSIRVN